MSAFVSQPKNKINIISYYQPRCGGVKGTNDRLVSGRYAILIKVEATKIRTKYLLLANRCKRLSLSLIASLFPYLIWMALLSQIRRISKLERNHVIQSTLSGQSIVMFYFFFFLNYY